MKLEFGCLWIVKNLLGGLRGYCVRQNIFNIFGENMESLIVMSLVLAILQIWIIPMVLNMKNMNWLLSNREDSDEPSEMLARARRASTNLQESLPAFLALALLSMIVSVDVTSAACWWLIFRVAHGATYILGITYVRTLAWFGSIGSLIAMACALV